MANVTVIGGGNMGSLLAVKFSQKHNVTLFLNSPYEKPDEYSKEMELYNEDFGSLLTGKIEKVTDCLEEAVSGAEWIFVTYPAFLFEDFSKHLIPLLSSGQHLVGIPGSGGFELFFHEALEKGATITGLQRVHSVARVMKKGRKVRESGVRSGIRCASIPASFGEEAAKFLSDCYSLPVSPLENYLNITLINSNPILHTSRLYSVFKDYTYDREYSVLPLFYEEWSLESSELLVKMDAELFEMIKKLKESEVHVREITTLLEHYEAKDAEGMTRKLQSIQSLKGLKTPSVEKENGKLIPDLKSRYFTADFPFGLDILLAFSEVIRVDAVYLREVSDWYHRIMQTPRVFTLKQFGINSIENLKEFYLN